MIIEITEVHPSCGWQKAPFEKDSLVGLQFSAKDIQPCLDFPDFYTASITYTGPEEIIGGIFMAYCNCIYGFKYKEIKTQGEKETCAIATAPSNDTPRESALIQEKTVEVKVRTAPTGQKRNRKNSRKRKKLNARKVSTKTNSRDEK